MLARPAAAALDGVAATDATAAKPPAPWAVPSGAPLFTPGRVLVQLAADTGGRRLADATVPLPDLPGVELAGMSGQHFDTPLELLEEQPAAAAGGAADRPVLASGDATLADVSDTSAGQGGAGISVPADAVLMFQIIDGASVAAKVAELQAHPGAQQQQHHHHHQHHHQHCWYGTDAHSLRPAAAEKQRCSREPGEHAAVHACFGMQAQQPLAPHRTCLTACLPAAPVVSAAAAVATVEPDYLHYPTAVPNDALFAAGTRYSGLWHLPAISAPAAWDVTTGSSEVCAAGAPGRLQEGRCATSPPTAPARRPCRRATHIHPPTPRSICVPLPRATPHDSRSFPSRTLAQQVKVCVIDTGAQPSHQDLAGNIAGGWNRAFGADNSQPLPDTPEYSDFSDQGDPASRAWCMRRAALPWPGQLALVCTSGAREGGCKRARPRALPPPPTLPPAGPSSSVDAVGHGTTTAGVLAAAGNNGVGVTGVAWSASLYICKATAYNSIALSAAALLDCYRLCREVRSAGLWARPTAGAGRGNGRSACVQQPCSSRHPAGHLRLHVLPTPARSRPLPPSLSSPACRPASRLCQPPTRHPNTRRSKSRPSGIWPTLERWWSPPQATTRSTVRFASFCG